MNHLASIEQDNIRNAFLLYLVNGKRRNLVMTGKQAIIHYLLSIVALFIFSAAGCSHKQLTEKKLEEINEKPG